MKYLFGCMLALAVLACNSAPTEADLQEDLKSAMLNFLYSKVNNDSSKVRYRIENDVLHYNDAAYYACEFKVRMLIPGRQDTIGYMKAYISKDFKEVRRNY